MSQPSACSEMWHRRVSYYQDGGLSPAERTEVEAHLETCTACQTILSSYDNLYRSLRGTPGYEGELASGPPTPRRRGLNVTRASTQGPTAQGFVAMVMVLLMAVVLIVGRQSGILGPASLRTATTGTITPVSQIAPNPTYGPRFADGMACANAGGNSPMIYFYTTDTGDLWQTTACNTPTVVSNLGEGDYELGSWSPGALAITAFSSLNNTGNGPRWLSIITTRDGKVHVVDLGSTSANADEAVWASPTTLIVRSHSTLLMVDTQTNTTTPMGIYANHIAWRAGLLFYSTVSQGAATLHSYSVRDKTDTTLMSLGAGAGDCATTGCPWTTSWDVSATGNEVIYQSPLPTPATVPTDANSSTAASVVYQSFGHAPTTTLMSAPLRLASPEIRFSPNTQYVAANIHDLTQQNTLQVMSLDGKTKLEIPAQTNFAWRLDSGAIVTGPAYPTANTPPQLLLVTSGNVAVLAPLTANYLWGS